MIIQSLSGHRKSRNMAWQIIAVVVIVAIMGWMFQNAQQNYEVRNLNFGWDFLTRSGNIPIGETLVAYATGDANYRVFVVGLLNTILVAVIGIALSTLFGTILGIARLSGNMIASRAALSYVEYVRNVPLLAHLFIIYFLLQKLPPIRSAWSLGDLAYLSNRGLVVPALSGGAFSNTFLVASLIFLTIALFSHLLRRTTVGVGTFPTSILIFATKAGLILSAISLVCFSASMEVSIPQFDRRRFVGGWSVTPEFLSIVLGLTIYYSSFIAEIVRGGILSVPRGQWESAAALGLKRQQSLRLVVLPQALRLIIPPATSQYLDLAKMTSLAIVIGFPDLVSVTNSIINDTGRAIEAVALIMFAFLMINLTISIFMNWLNGRVALVGRS
ncbi:amino acid ABC transporter permease [Sinorhizobium americanum]|uniref:Glutamate Aspartate transport system permease protein GltJ n=1 Tax=Sinorhizobium americanum TaxID=194963 RepID=A0A1L3LTK2_9HYPH|nr:ABC transporter permease subunit [Sinorhizobium americanum]APG93393.1 glutamate Aspartate transport system permease protein GltJ [Sinorhizobium americanum]OAP45518.1 hypothetical protein ATC00_24320 [Sinorhizobium americanum]